MTTAPTCPPLGGVMLAGLIAFAATAPLAHGQLACGGTIGPGGSFSMTGDLLCAGSPALTVVGPVTLVMNGYTVQCTGGLSTGIRVQGKGARILNGNTGLCTVAVDVGGEGGHKLENVLVRGGPPIGFGVTSDGNALVSNRTIGAGYGFQILGNKNKLAGNIALSNGVAGFTTSGLGNQFSRNVAIDRVETSGTGDAIGFGLDATSAGAKLKDNVAVNSVVGFDVLGLKHQIANNAAQAGRLGFRIAGDGQHTVQNNVTVGALLGFSNEGFLVSSNRNKVKKNRAMSHGVGFHVTGQENALSGNHASGNGMIRSSDAVDGNPDCDGNAWKGNLFHVASPACVQ